ncbi:RDD family protein [Mucilaginibacter gotjawali]|uniref:RDD family membrane protein YckC n=2 Tax=Mucilaginibacter gotjawali TaxID=1550579 RepID=A0A839SKA7_9SPHI|nr:RDD family protein [Mucilaginibacter gotjawali]MBB3057892.1 putative RDD family membrane protein YckC [Mucilaginibacter gotjawali]BAU52336.1 RDD family protein [Mucilaginibacter gotjawali]
MQPLNISTLQPSNKGNTYLLVINGKPEGPYSIEQLKALKIKPADFVRTEGMDDYKQAHEVAELRELFGFKKEAVIPQYFGSFDQRLTASALDWFFVLLVCVPIAFIVSVFIQDQAQRIMVAFSLAVIVPLVKIIYHIVMECSAKQATFGKQLIRIKVCDMEGKRISFGRSLWRNVAKLFSVAPFFLGYIFSFFNKTQQCMHDMLAGTLVMKDRLF